MQHLLVKMFSDYLLFVISMALLRFDIENRFTENEQAGPSSLEYL